MRPARRSRVFGAAALLVTTALLLAACNQGGAIRRQALQDSNPVTFDSTDGVALSGRLFGPEHARAGVVLAHMLPSDQSSWFDFADRIGKLGYAALTFDFRGYCPGGDAGCSEGSKDVASIWQDVEGAVGYLRSRGVRTVALVGASMGGTASLIVAGREGNAIAAVVTLSAPQSISGLVAGPDVLANLTAAKLFVAGNGDTVAAEAAQAMFDQSPQPKELQIVTSDDHGTDLLEGNQAEIVRNLVIGYLQVHAPA
ncbi:MAG: alpha/beta fold hydrolase [Actinobacteria bacterium]|nr:alpha/beta fold hydrolase [Actinomycetota bacterium]